VRGFQDALFVCRYGRPAAPLDQNRDRHGAVLSPADVDRSLPLAVLIGRRSSHRPEACSSIAGGKRSAATG
jgi:hypothetical protein